MIGSRRGAIPYRVLVVIQMNRGVFSGVANRCRKFRSGAAHSIASWSPAATASLGRLAGSLCKLRGRRVCSLGRSVILHDGTRTWVSRRKRPLHHQRNGITRRNAAQIKATIASGIGKRHCLLAIDRDTARKTDRKTGAEAVHFPAHRPPLFRRDQVHLGLSPAAQAGLLSVSAARDIAAQTAARNVWIARRITSWHNLRARQNSEQKQDVTSPFHR